jgi:hypothetical protein
MGHFCPPGSGSVFKLRIRIRIRNPAFLKDKKSKKSQNSRNQGFSSFFACGDGSIRIHTNKLRNWERIQEAQKHTDPSGPDPEHRMRNDKESRFVNLSLQIGTHSSELFFL